MPKMPPELLKYNREYQRNYAAEHPEKRKQWRISAAINLLKREGWQLIPPAAAAKEVGE